MSAEQHKHSAPPPGAIRIAVVTVSDTRTLETDEGGRLVTELCQAHGHQIVAHDVLPDEPAQVAGLVKRHVLGGGVDVVLLTGGTGISHRDTTVEALTHIFEKTLDGFGELFRALSFAEIGPAAMLSRAIAGVIGAVAVFSMPGSPAAVRLALERLVLPELGHVLAERRRHLPPSSPPHGGHGHGHKHKHEG